MAAPLTDIALDQLFREARTNQYFDGRPVSQQQIHALWDLMKMAPTSMNQLPARIVWCHTQAAKDRLAAHVMPGNVDKVQNAPVCAILAMDLNFHDHLPMLFPSGNAKPMFDANADMRQTNAFRNSSLQGGYLIMAARALGLDCGPMSGFNNAAVDADFFADEPGWKSNFICSIGYGDPARLHPRGPRPDFDLFNRIV